MYKGRTSTPRLKLYSKTCKRCNQTYETEHKYSKVCLDCSKPSYWRKNERKK